MNVIIYHNPACGTSRKVLELIRGQGHEPTVIEYLKTPPRRDELTDLIARSGGSARDMLRDKGGLYESLNLADLALSDEDLVDAMMLHPELINRPIVSTPKGAKLCRPPESVLELL
jgi:arsenate reductase